jgi:hypothetical protein
MDEASLDDEILLALRRNPGSSCHVLAEALGLPRTNFGRRLEIRLRQPLERLLATGLIEQERDRYRLTAEGRQRISARVGGIPLVDRPSVEQETPGRGVPLRRKEVAPVLPDKPRAEKDRGFGAARKSPDFDDRAHQENG